MLGHERDLRRAILALLSELDGEMLFGEVKERLVGRFFGRVKHADESRVVRQLGGPS